MCAVIGIKVFSPSTHNFKLIRNIFINSKIRGLHATGISYSKGGELVTIKEPIPADHFCDRYMKDHMLMNMIDDGVLSLIGHCRYSTSDLEYNQPISTNKKSIVHNGVITQEPPETWSAKYFVEFKTKNDSEIILHSETPLESYYDTSMGVCELTLDGKLVFYRSGKRPLYYKSGENFCYVVSTKDIAERSNLSKPIEVEPFKYYSIKRTPTPSIKIPNIQEERVDLQ